MNTKEVITKLKEVIFIKKGTGQPFKDEEDALKSIEEEAAAKEKFIAEVRAELEEVEALQDKSRSNRNALRKKLIAKAKEWQVVAMELFREERTGEELFERGIRLEAQLGHNIDSKARSFKGRTIFIGSNRARWIDEELDVLDEGFRRELMLDNKKYFTEKKPKRKHQHRKGPTTRIFIPSQVLAIKNAGVPLPDWMEKAYDRWTIENAKKKRAGYGANSPYQIEENE